MQTQSPLRRLLVALAALGLAFAGGRVFADQHGSSQPHMANALNALRNARTELQEAERNKGGYRTQAQQLVTQAIGEVEAGIAYAGGK